MGKAVKFVRCNDAEENKLLQQHANKKWMLNIQFEIMSRATTQRNHHAELGFKAIHS